MALSHSPFHPTHLGNKMSFIILDIVKFVLLKLFLNLPGQSPLGEFPVRRLYNCITQSLPYGTLWYIKVFFYLLLHSEKYLNCVTEMRPSW